MSDTSPLVPPLLSTPFQSRNILHLKWWRCGRTAWRDLTGQAFGCEGSAGYPVLPHDRACSEQLTSAALWFQLRPLQDTVVQRHCCQLPGSNTRWVPDRINLMVMNTGVYLWRMPGCCASRTTCSQGVLEHTSLMKQEGPAAVFSVWMREWDYLTQLWRGNVFISFLKQIWKYQLDISCFSFWIICSETFCSNQNHNEALPVREPGIGTGWLYFGMSAWPKTTKVSWLFWLKKSFSIFLRQKIL